MFHRLDSTVPLARTARSGLSREQGGFADGADRSPEHFTTDYSETFDWTGEPDDDELGTPPGLASAGWLARARRERRRRRLMGAMSWLFAATTTGVVVLAAAHWLGHVDLTTVAASAGVL